MSSSRSRSRSARRWTTSAARSGFMCSLRATYFTARTDVSRPHTSESTTPKKHADEEDADHRGGDVDGAEAPQRDRDEQARPEDDVQEHGRAEAGGGQREAGVGALDARQRQQAVAEGRAGGAAAWHHARDGPGRQLDPHHARQRDRPRRQRLTGELAVGDEGTELEGHAQEQQRGADARELLDGRAEPGQLRQDEVVEREQQDDELDRALDPSARGRPLRSGVHVARPTEGHRSWLAADGLRGRGHAGHPLSLADARARPAAWSARMFLLHGSTPTIKRCSSATSAGRNSTGVLPRRTTTRSLSGTTMRYWPS